MKRTSDSKRMKAAFDGEKSAQFEVFQKADEVS
jgi:hypothetical protein